MTITLRFKEIENGNISLYLDIYDKGKRKFEFLNLYLLPEVNDRVKEQNKKTLEQAHLIRAERILHPETIPQAGSRKDKRAKDDKSPELMDWIDTYIDMQSNGNYSKAIVGQTEYLRDLMERFLEKKRSPHITLVKFNEKWFKAFFAWLKDEYVPRKYVRVCTKPLSHSSLCNLQQRIVAVFNKAVKEHHIKTNPFYKLSNDEIFEKPTASLKHYLTKDELIAFMASAEKSPGVAETQRAFGFACLTGLRYSDIVALRWSDFSGNTLIIEQKKTKALVSVPVCSTAMGYLPKKGKDGYVFHLPAHANVDSAIKRIAKRVGINRTISFHTARHTFATLVQSVAANIETTKSLMGHASVKSTAIYAEVMTDDKVKAICNVKIAFGDIESDTKNPNIHKTKRTAATNKHPRKIENK